MDATNNPTADSTAAHLGQAKADLGNGVRHVKDAASGEIRKLMADVDDLVARVSAVRDPDLVRVRDRVQAALASTRDALVSGAGTVQRQVKHAAVTTDDYVRASPWQAVGIAALAGVTLGYLAGRQR